MSRSKIIEIAASQVGTKETPPNSNKTPYGQWYGFDGFAWCAMFVSWVYDQAGHPLGHIDDDKGYRDCRSGYNYWKAKGELTSAPEKGDIVLFDWNGDGACDHTGIFNEWLDANQTQFSSYEGNTAKGNDSDGGCVMLRTDRHRASVKAFVKSAVLKVAGEAASTVSTNISKGAIGADVATIQKYLYDLEYSIIVDGNFGPATEKQVMQFQKDNNFEATGIVTPALEGYMATCVDKKIADTKLTTGTFLRKGDSGQAVYQLQLALNKVKGLSKITPDGVFGNETLASVKQFQQLKNITVDGIVGPQTFQLLKG